MLVQGHIEHPLHSQISWSTLTNSTMLTKLDFWKNSLPVLLLELKSKVFTVIPWTFIWHGIIIFENSWEFLQHSCCTCSYFIFVRQTQLEVPFSDTFCTFFLRKVWLMISCLDACVSNNMPIPSNNIWTDLQILMENVDKHYTQEFLPLLCNLLHQ
jgi:hypothetical protein